MRQLKKNIWIVITIYLFYGLQFSTAQSQPLGLFLTWQQDPTTTMTIDWHVESEETRESVFRYRISGENSAWTLDTASQYPFPFSERTIQRIEVTGLNAGTEYEFKLGDYQRIYKFRTMPENNFRPIRFVDGGDVSTGERFRTMNKIAMKYDPDFIIWGGDLAYANAKKDNLKAWYKWFDGIKEDLITEDGRVVPIVLTIGNHDVTNHHYPYAESTMKEKGMWYDFIKQVKSNQFPESTTEWRNENAPFYYGLFAFPGHPGYGVLDFGSYLSLICLDSSHSNLVSGKQTDWLENVLQQRAGKMAHIIPFYHKQAYPSKRVHPGGVRSQFWSVQIFKNWVPLFEKYGVKVALEHDDHTFKRTYPLLKDRIAPSGIVYIGDGAWGVDPETPKTPDEVWYLEKTASMNHVVVVTLQGPFQHFLMINNEGKAIDEYPEVPR
ncbi:fibronectin type III domain-containing protein [Membranihabitans maritimus]|uniref:fibronectin type III domain-containing protein n=1 Tax=Membranihabitans maritimus TaxID=2904244 RepID=UPI001F01F533|nr:fibronectin type III domain-containing protein [Membranihabitans maritimus]